MNTKIKSRWLASLFVFYIVQYLYAFFKAVFGQFIQIFEILDPMIAFKYFVVKFQSPEILLAFFLVCPAISFLLGGVTYYCAYKKKGTRWLGVYMVGLLVHSLLALQTFFQGYHFGPEYEIIQFDVMFRSILTFYVAIYHLYYCYRLAKLNLSLRQQNSNITNSSN